MTFSVTEHALHLLRHRGSQPEPEVLFRPPLWSLLSGMAPESLCAFVESPQQAAAGAISASFTGDTAQAFHLSQGYGFVAPEQKKKNNAPQARSNTAKNSCVCVARGRALSKTFITAVDWVVLTKMHIRRRGMGHVSVLYLVISDL